MIKSVLIANRGEIASRIIRTCKQMGIESIAVYSDADRNSPFVHQADTAIHIGASQPSESYLVAEKIIEAAKRSGADAIHPGFGFLSENKDFAQRCIDEGIVFIGPHPKAIDLMGSKSKAKTIMKDSEVPIIPGYQGSDQSVETLSKAAKEIGFPVLLKATAGGGGKGMRIVHKAAEVKDAIAAAKREAQSSFGDDELIIEKYFPSARHIEFQIFGDKHGNAIHVLERECSIQRRYQKVVEESPSSVMTKKLRDEMGKAAVNAAKAIEYDNAGTVEFILVGKDEFYFLEVNTRLQVEHPVTEMITGLDLVQLQIEVADGQPLEIKQADLSPNGYALECRLYAEDPANDFLPVTGDILAWEKPLVEGLRFDTGIESGSAISIYYDPMIAKVIAHGKDRLSTIRKMEYALRNLVCLGMTTNQDFLIHLMQQEDFIAGKYDTHFIKNKIDTSAVGKNKTNFHPIAALAVCLKRWSERDANRSLLQQIPSTWRSNFYQHQAESYLFGEEEITVNYRKQKEHFEILIGEKTHEVQLLNTDQTKVKFILDGMTYQCTIANKEESYFVHHPKFGQIKVQLKPRFPAIEEVKIKGGYAAPMPGQVVKILVQSGAKVKSGDGLVVLSSMKMENTIVADEDGKVDEVYVEEGENIEAGVLLVKVD